MEILADKSKNLFGSCDLQALISERTVTHTRGLTKKNLQESHPHQKYNFILSSQHMAVNASLMTIGYSIYRTLAQEDIIKPTNREILIHMSKRDISGKGAGAILDEYPERTALLYAQKSCSNL